VGAKILPRGKPHHPAFIQNLHSLSPLADPQVAITFFTFAFFFPSKYLNHRFVLSFYIHGYFPCIPSFVVIVLFTSVCLQLFSFLSILCLFSRATTLTRLHSVFASPFLYIYCFPVSSQFFVYLSVFLNLTRHLALLASFTLLVVSWSRLHIHFLFFVFMFPTAPFFEPYSK
jgi:hypothetical protein